MPSAAPPTRPALRERYYRRQERVVHPGGTAQGTGNQESREIHATATAQGRRSQQRVCQEGASGDCKEAAGAAQVGLDVPSHD